MIYRVQKIRIRPNPSLNFKLGFGRIRISVLKLGSGRVQIRIFKKLESEIFNLLDMFINDNYVKYYFLFREKSLDNIFNVLINKYVVILEKYILKANKKRVSCWKEIKQHTQN